MNGVRYWRAGFATLLVALLAYGCGDDPMSPDSAMTPTAAQTADEAADEASQEPSFAVYTDLTLGLPSDPAGANYKTGTQSASGSETICNSFGCAHFLQYDEDESSGTGVFDPFVRISANTLLQQGVNTSGRKVGIVWDENSSPQYTRDLRLDEVPTIECPASFVGYSGQTCREFALDINEVGSDPLWYLSLDAVRIYISENQKICDEDGACNGGANAFQFDPTSQTFGTVGAQLIWAMDGLAEETNYGIGLNYQLDNGSGRADLVLYVPESLLPPDVSDDCRYDQGLGGDDCGEYVHFYSHFGADQSQDDGFEEWDVRVLPIVLVEKTANVVADKRWNWTVEKTPDASYDLFTGDQIVQQYGVSVDKVDFDYENYRVNGTITITNPDKQNPALITKVTDVFGTVDLTSTLSCSDGLDPASDGTVAPPYELAKNSSVTCTYGPYSIGDDFTTETNVATVRLESGGQFEGSADADAADLTVDDEIDESVTLTDDVKTDLSEQFTDDGSTSYQLTWSCDADEGDNVNTATITGDDSDEVLGTDDATVTLNCYDLTVTKNATTAFERKYFWTIDKEADETSIGPLSSGQSYLVNYDVTVDLDDTTPYTDSKWAVSGTITIANNNPSLPADLTNVADVVSPDIGATVDCSGATSVGAGTSIQCSYSADLPNADARTNTATATMQNKKYFWNDAAPENIGTTSYSNSPAVDVTFGDPTSEIDECINVSDTFPEFASQNTDVTVCADDPLPELFEYAKTFYADDFPDCTESEAPNTAKFTTNDTGTEGTDGWVLTIIRECPSCNLTQGYWKTHNDQFWGGAPEDPTWYVLNTNGADELFFINDFSWFDAMWTPPAGNAYWQLSRQWIAATLNVTAGSDGSSVSAQLQCGEALFGTYSPDQVALWDNDSGGSLAGCPLTANPTRHDVIMWAAALDSFNNSNHCDDDGQYASDYDDSLPID